MRIKAAPEDFIVEEQIRLPLAQSGPHSIFRIRKSNVTTLHVQERLSALLHVGKERITFPALKDKDAIATQYASIAGAPAELPAIDAQREGFELERVGRAERPLQPADLRGNKFKIVIRDLSLEEAQKLGPRLRQMGEYGLPNYFDEQRFGSYSGAVGFIGKQILQRDAEGALKTYLSEKMAGDPERVRVFKEYAAAHWGDWAALMERAPKPSNFRSVLTYLKDHPTDGYRKALNLIPHGLLALYLSAYQSWLWNLIGARAVSAAPTVRVAGQDLPVYYNLPESLRRRLDRLQVPLPNHRADFADAVLARAAHEVLAQERLTLNDFKARILKKAFAAKSLRPLVVHPADITAGESENDELARKRWKLTLQFGLPPGSYATLVIKAVTR